MVYLCNCVKNSKQRKMCKIEIEKNGKNRRKSKFIDVLFVLNLNWKHFAAYSDHWINENVKHKSKSFYKTIKEFAFLFSFLQQKKNWKTPTIFHDRKTIKITLKIHLHTKYGYNVEQVIFIYFLLFSAHFT